MERQSGSSFLPIRVNTAGMIPLIFAFSIIILPGTIASYFRNPLDGGFVNTVATFFTNTLDPSNLPYWIAVFILVVMFTFFIPSSYSSSKIWPTIFRKMGGLFLE